MWVALGFDFFFIFLGSPKAHSKTGWPWPHSNPFACLTNARIADANHHAWHCFVLSPYFNCKWLYIFLRCIYPLVFKSWGKWLCGPPVLLLYGAQYMTSSPRFTVDTWPSAIISLLLSVERKGRQPQPCSFKDIFQKHPQHLSWPHLGFHPGADSHQERGKGENAWFKIHTFCFRRGWENRPWGSAWRSLRLACFRVCQVSWARKLHSWLELFSHALAYLFLLAPQLILTNFI